jgi:hypothetical protein
MDMEHFLKCLLQRLVQPQPLSIEVIELEPRKLNQSIINHDSFESEISMNPDEIQQDLDVMRSCIVTLAYMYQEGKFEVLKDPKFETFNEQEDED